MRRTFTDDLLFHILTCGRGIGFVMSIQTCLIEGAAIIWSPSWPSAASRASSIGFTIRPRPVDSASETETQQYVLPCTGCQARQTSQTQSDLITIACYMGCTDYFHSQRILDNQPQPTSTWSSTHESVFHILLVTFHQMFDGGLHHYPKMLLQKPEPIGVLLFWCYCFSNSAEIVAQFGTKNRQWMQKHLSSIAGTELSYDFGWIPTK